MQCFIDHFSERFVPTEVLVVKFRVASRVNATEVLHAVKLLHCVSDQIAELQSGAALESVMQLTVFVELGVLVHDVLDKRAHGWIYCEVRDVKVSRILLLIGDTASK